MVSNYFVEMLRIEIEIDIHLKSHELAQLYTMFPREHSGSVVECLS